MSPFLHKHPFLFLIILLLLAALACQAPTAFQEQSSPDVEAVAAAVVATVEAQAPVVRAGEAQTAVTTIDSDLEAVLTNLYQRLNPSVVHIFVYGSFGELTTGSGFLYDNAGHVVTNNHVVANGTEFEVAFVAGDRVRAAVVGTDVDSDLAVLKLDRVPEGVAPIPLGDSEAVQPGQFVVAIGNPFGEAGSMSIGIISGLGRTLESQRDTGGPGSYSLPKVLQTDAAINPGNSGGPLLNLAGEVVGVNSAILTRTGTNSGVGFSIPVEAVARIVPTLIAEGAYTYPYIGISMAPPLTLDTLEEWGLPIGGVYVSSVTPNTPAAEAGLVGSINRGGDYITAVDGMPIRDSGELIAYLVFETAVGQTIELTVIRDGQEAVVPLTLGARP
ncbi:MAG: trypsin-like peptidase domain-containing protein [Anaerolineales bacterium]|nr:trypsin-like peptidase domain-containing protein [Anaerolineales bacterium]MCB0055889.1 trypsin-like peptidase domain-containing protein [Caldilineaceae bacterium]